MMCSHQLEVVEIWKKVDKFLNPSKANLSCTLLTMYIGCTNHSILCYIAVLNITLPTKVHIVKAMVFPVVLYRCAS